MKIVFIPFIAKYFRKGNVSVIGEKGSGKDLIFGNVIHFRQKIRKELNYISNLNYTDGDGYIKFDYKDIDLNGNTYDTMLNEPLYYEFPHPEGTDIYLSDAGCYFPAQYCNELNKKYPSIPYFAALSRQIAKLSFHTNCQQLTRVWDKLREQSFNYIRCVNTLYVPYIHFCITEVIIYDKYQSAADRVTPCRIKVPTFGDKNRILQAQIAIDKFVNTYGSVKRYYVLYFNHSKHDTYYFKKVFKDGKKKDENKK